MTAISVLASLLLPLLTGTLLCHALLQAGGRFNWAQLLGHGYALGTLLVILLLKLWFRLGLPPVFWPVAGALALIAAAALALVLMRRRTLPSPPPPARLKAWQYAAFTLLAGFIALRYAILVNEMLLRPAFAWDTWVSWAPKAVVWFHFGEMVHFVSASDWLHAGAADGLVYTGESWQYPEGIPTLLLWQMLAAGSSSSSLIFLPWLIAPVAMLLCLYGHMRQDGLPLGAALLFTYALASLPFLNVHIALPGYADTWLAFAFASGALSLHGWLQGEGRGYLPLALAAALLCVLVKASGLAFALILLLVMAAGALSSYRLCCLVLAALCTCILLAMGLGLKLELPWLGTLSLSFHSIRIPRLEELHLGFHPVFRSLLTSAFEQDNWHLLWYLPLPVFLWCAIHSPGRLWPRAIAQANLLALGLIVFIFVFTDRYRYAENFTQIGRAVLYLVPTLVFHLAYSCRDLFLPAKSPAHDGGQGRTPVYTPGTHP